jgi:hypothetical protein
MGRSSWHEDDDDDGRFNLFHGNLKRSLRGKKGQAALRELESVLLAMPDKALWSGVFVEPSGEVCALGAVAVARKVASGLSLDEALSVCADVDPDESEDAGVALGFPALVSQAIVWENDEANTTVWEVAYGPVPRGHGIYKGGIALVRDMTPQERYAAMLAWVQRHLL